MNFSQKNKRTAFRVILKRAISRAVRGIPSPSSCEYDAFKDYPATRSNFSCLSEQFASHMFKPRNMYQTTNIVKRLMSFFEEEYGLISGLSSADERVRTKWGKKAVELVLGDNRMSRILIGVLNSDEAKLGLGKELLVFFRENYEAFDEINENLKKITEANANRTHRGMGGEMETIGRKAKIREGDKIEFTANASANGKKEVYEGDKGVVRVIDEKRGTTKIGIKIRGKEELFSFSIKKAVKIIRLVERGREAKKLGPAQEKTKVLLRELASFGRLPKDRKMIFETYFLDYAEDLGKKFKEIGGGNMYSIDKEMAKAKGRGDAKKIMDSMSVKEQIEGFSVNVGEDIRSSGFELGKVFKRSILDVASKTYDGVISEDDLAEIHSVIYDYYLRYNRNHEWYAIANHTPSGEKDKKIVIKSIMAYLKNEVADHSANDILDI